MWNRKIDEVKNEKNKEEKVEVIDHADFLGSEINDNDYCKTFKRGSGVCVGTVSVQASRRYQEDRLVVGVKEVEGFSQLPFESQNVALKKTFEQMQEAEVCSDYKRTGSTCSAAITWIDEMNNLHVTTANVGDSATYLVILDEKNQILRSELLTKAHKPEDPEEEARIKENYGSIVWIGGCYRIEGDGGWLGMSRALGDKTYESSGLIHDPTIEHTSIKLLPMQKAFVLVASDGIDPLVKQEGLSILGKIISDHADQDPSCIAAAVVKKSLEVINADNNSVAVIKPSMTLASASVFDGHFGDEISGELSKVFYTLLAKNIQLELVKQKSHEVSPDSPSQKNKR